MNDRQKSEFVVSLNVTMELCNHYPLSAEAIMGYWSALRGFDLDVVRGAMNEWVDGNDKAPTINQLKSLCKPKEPVYQALPRPVDHASNQAHAKEVKAKIDSFGKLKGDGRDWARKLVSGKKISNWPEARKHALAVLESFGEV
jgi:hypothetical protein